MGGADGSKKEEDRHSHGKDEQSHSDTRGMHNMVNRTWGRLENVHCLWFEPYHMVDVNVSVSLFTPVDDKNPTRVRKKQVISRTPAGSTAVHRKAETLLNSTPCCPDLVGRRGAEATRCVRTVSTALDDGARVA